MLEDLTRVPELTDKYVGKVKLIYIDLSFNIQQVFRSNDDALEHSVWMTMMRGRFLQMRKPLSEDGSIWVHLDDIEIHRMKVLLDEEFGSLYHVSTIAGEKAQNVRNDTDISSAISTTR